ncbi:MAG: alanine racemase [Solirubrobacterales bacterium]
MALPARVSQAAAAPERAIAYVDAGAVERNCALLKERLGAADLCAVVKADGYGHGATACAAAAVAGGATWMAVATATEAAELRRDGVGERILVMGALTRADLELALEADADLVAWREGFARAAAALASPDRPARLHVKLDTGMGRLGTPDAAEALRIAALAHSSDSLEPAGLMTHFATADDPGSRFFDEQLGRFSPLVEEFRRLYPGCVVHAANSAAVLRATESHFDMGRCGIAVYGLDPFGVDALPRGLEPALALHSYVADVKTLRAGDTVGYGRTWSAPAATHVAVLPIGYGDGYGRGLSNAADVLVRGRRRPVVGTVSMDNITVDVGAQTDVQPGDEATLIGVQAQERVTAEELARLLDTINYEVTCGISPRVPRVPGSGASGP